jgi:acetolactate decarboxylase
MLQIVQALSHMVDSDEVFQHSTIQALLQGKYEGSITYSEVFSHGDFGIGTFHQLDGEMIALDGEFFQVRSDGVVSRVKEEQTTPFAMVKFFETDIERQTEGEFPFESLLKRIESLLPSSDQAHAVKVSGLFREMKLRAARRQSPPYPPLKDMTQAEFSYEEVRGTCVGFYFPHFQGINVPGFHFHFLSEDNRFGGHLFSAIAVDPLIEIDDASLVHLALGDESDESQDELDEEQRRILHRVEFKG